MKRSLCLLAPPVPSIEELIQKAKTFVAAAKAPATIKAYRNDWRDFESWCREHQLTALPSTPETVALYIADRASILASGTIARRLTSITSRRGSRIIVIGNSTQVSIYHKGKLIELHDRITDPNISKSTKECHKAPWQRSILEGSYYRKRAARLGPYVEEIIVRLLIQGNGFIDTERYGAYCRSTRNTLPMTLMKRQKALSRDFIQRFFGGPPLAVLGKLVLLSILVGVILAALGLDPWNIIEIPSSA